MKLCVLNDFSYYNDLVAAMLLHRYDEIERHAVYSPLPQSLSH